MSAQPQPEMSEKVLARMRKRAEPILEPGETVLYGVFNLTVPMWVYGATAGILLLPYMAQKYSLALVTEQNVYVLKTALSGKPRGVLLKAPLGSVEAHVGGSGFPGRYLMIGDQKVWLHFRRTATDPARAIAAAASSGLEAIGQQAPDASASAADQQQEGSPTRHGEEGVQQPPA